MKFRLKNAKDLQPKSGRYWKVMRPLWGQFKSQAKNHFKIDWMPVETPGPLELILVAKLAHEKIEYLELRASVSDQGVELRNGAVIITFDGWEGVVLTREGDKLGGFSTDKRRTLEEAAAALKSICGERFQLEM